MRQLTFYVLQVEDQNELKQNITVTTTTTAEDVSTGFNTFYQSVTGFTDQLVPKNMLLEISNSTFFIFTASALSNVSVANSYLSSATNGTALTETYPSASNYSELTINNNTDNSSFDTFITFADVSEINDNSSYIAENVSMTSSYATSEAIDIYYETHLDYNDESNLIEQFSNESDILHADTTVQNDTSTFVIIDSTIAPEYEEEEILDDYETTDTPKRISLPSTALVPTSNNIPVYRKQPRRLCWETMFGQELVKLTVMDLILTVLYIIVIDFFRAVFVRYVNGCWCWDLEKRFPQYGDFKVAENILHLVNNQGMVWMGMFFSPGLIVLNVTKLFIIMYLRSWAVLTCNVPHEVLFRASRSNNFYYALLLMMLFLCVLPVGYAIVWIKPSEYCGPFSNCDKIYHIFTKTIKRNIPRSFFNTLEYVASPAIVIPLLLLLVLIIYYFVSLTTALREANDDLKVYFKVYINRCSFMLHVLQAQLFIERTEERRKVFQIAKTKKRESADSEEIINFQYAKWKKLLRELPSTRLIGESPKLFSRKIDTGREKKCDSDGVLCHCRYVILRC